MNTGELIWPAPEGAAVRVRAMQTKLHHWAVKDSGRLFDDVFNLVCDPDFLTVAWGRVRGNKGARTAGVDRRIPALIAEGAEVVEFLGQVREQLKSRTFVPLPVRERLIPKPGSSKLRRLGIPTTADRVVQAALALVLEPIFEADFKPVSYGFRPRRRAQENDRDCRRVVDIPHSRCLGPGSSYATGSGRVARSRKARSRRSSILPLAAPATARRATASARAVSPTPTAARASASNTSVSTQVYESVTRLHKVPAFFIHSRAVRGLPSARWVSPMVFAASPSQQGS